MWSFQIFCWYFAVVFVQTYLHLYDISSNRWSDNWFSCFSVSASHTEIFLCVCSSFACHGWAVISVTLGAMGGLWSLLLWVPWVGCDFCYFGCHGWAVISVTLGAMGGLWSLLLWVPWVGCDLCNFGCHGWAVISVTLGAMGGLWSLQLWVPWMGCDLCNFGCHGWAVISVTLCYVLEYWFVLIWATPWENVSSGVSD